MASAILQRLGRNVLTRRLARALLGPLKSVGLVPRHAIADIFGYRIELDLNEMVDFKVFLYGSFDERGLALIGGICKSLNCRSVLDIGANIGNHSAFLSRHAMAVYAFEPDPNLFARLKQFIDQNRIGNVKAFELGVSNSAGSMPLFGFPGLAHLTSFHMSAGMQKIAEARIVRGDDIVVSEAIADIDLIKIDVEGYEFEVLTGLQDTIRKHRPVIVMEFMETSIAKFGSEAKLRELLPEYAIFATKKNLKSKIFKSSLTTRPFKFGVQYLHILCVPEEKATQFPWLTP